MTPKFTSRKCEGNIGEAVEQQVEIVLEFTYLGDRVSAGGGCETSLTARTRGVWVKLRECGELLYDKRLPLELKWAVYRSNVMSAMCGAQLKDRKRCTYFMFILGLS